MPLQRDRYLEFLDECRSLAGSSEPFEVRGRLTRAAGLVMEAGGLKLPVGSQVLVVQGDGLKLDAEVVGFSSERLYLMPTSEPQGLRPGAMVVAQEPKVTRPTLHRGNHPWRRTEDRTRRLPVGDALLGRVLDPTGEPSDRRGPLISPPGQTLPYLP